MIIKRAIVTVCVLMLTAPLAALAKPQVSLHLSAFLVERNAGRRTEVPLADKPVEAGDTVRFIIEARNSGSSEALHLTPSDPIPARMTYVPGSARDGTSTVQFSLDGKTWSAHPMVRVKTVHGMVYRPADPSSYKAIRWVTHVALPAKRSFNYSYEARVNSLKKGAK